MNQLSTKGFERAQNFLQTEARPLELRRFESEFLGAPVDGVLAELRRFQNLDGGFGNGLEPDFRLPLSSPLATSVAFQILHGIDAPADHELVREGIAYLVGAFDPERGCWPSVPEAVNEYPRAPWWTFDPAVGKGLAETPANPSAEIAGILRRYPHNVPPELIQSSTEFALRYLDLQPERMNMHDVYCFLRLLDTLPAHLADPVLSKLRLVAQAIVSRDPREWVGYGPQPLDLVKSPDSPLAGLFQADLEANLDYRIETQNEDGSWSPTWAWDQFPETWETARQEWQGVLTFENLRLLERFGRLE